MDIVMTEQYKNLGFRNGWIEEPEEFKKCTHTHMTEHLYRPDQTTHKLVCTICKFYYRIDMSG